MRGDDRQPEGDGAEPLAQRHRWVFGWSFAAVVAGAMVAAYLLRWSVVVGIALVVGGLGAMIVQGIRHRSQRGLRGLMVVAVLVYGSGAAVLLAGLARHFRLLDLLRTWF